MENALKKGETYFVWDGEESNPTFFMIGKVTLPNNGDNLGSYRGEATTISSESQFRKDSGWAYYDQTRKFRIATPEEKYWLECCIEKNEYIPKNKIDFTKCKLNPNYEIY